MTEISRVGDFTLTWGESLRWDDRSQRLYFVDCAAQTLHWLNHADAPLQSMPLPSMPTGLVLVDDGRLVAALDDGLYLVDPDAQTYELLTPYPEGLSGRANDANADLDGNLVTGTLNLAPGPGSYWWYSMTDGWRPLDDGIGNANGPVVLELDHVPTLIIADTLASALYAYTYDGKAGHASNRRVFAQTGELGGVPDGACADERGGVWSCLAGAGRIVRYTEHGLDQVIETGVELPSDVTFGGPDLCAMFFVSIAISVGGVQVSSPNAGALMRIEDSGFRGRPEPRFQL
jgi:sugar lactone lactonase YvrE